MKYLIGLVVGCIIWAISYAALDSWLGLSDVPAYAAFIIFIFSTWYFIARFNPRKEMVDRVTDTVDALSSARDAVSSSLDSKNAEFFGIAEEEVDSKTYDKGLWSKALIKAKGDESLRKIEYIKMRAKQLKKSS